MLRVYIDEAGRGPLAGPVGVGLICLDDDALDLSNFNDSKILSAKQRESLFAQLSTMVGVRYAYAESSAAYIDRWGIIKALQQAVCKGLWQLVGEDLGSFTLKKLRQVVAGSELVLDGNHDFGLRRVLGVSVETIIKGDALVPSISMASIVAKVCRDRAMLVWDKKYPMYQFARHKGYGTLFHREAIRKYGLSPLHRRSFCGNILLS